MHSRVDDMVANPNRHFSAPREVLADNALTFDDKRRILESWKLDAERLAESTAENMSGGEESDLREVSKTLIELKAMTGDTKLVSRSPRRRQASMMLSVATGAVVGAGAGLVLLSLTTVAPVLTLTQTTVAGGLVGGLVRVFRKSVHV